MNRLILIISASILLWNCQAPKSNAVFIGGQIVKPSSSFVTVYFGNRVLDTFLLDKSTRFSRLYDSLSIGIYKMEHIPEFTSMLLEPGDSLWARINATDFQESLFFSGRGASKNNFLNDIRLRLELENDFLASQYANPPQVFKRIVDSLLREKKEQWIQMDSLNTMSPYAQKITQAAYIYPYASIQERYALLRGNQWDSIENNQFLSYRKFLNFGENDLAFFDPYITYLMNFLNREALHKGENYIEARQNTNFNLRRLEEIQNKIEGALVRNNLARAVAYEELLNFNNHESHDIFLDVYRNINSSSSYAEEINSLHEDINQMNEGKILPRIILQNAELKLLTSDDLWSKPTVVYFWSQTQMNHFKATINRVKKLKVKYPNYRFVGISIQPLNPIALEVYKMMALDSENQFGLVDFGIASKKWVITLLNKTIIVDSQGKIVNGFANIMAPDFEKAL